MIPKLASLALLLVGLLPMPADDAVLEDRAFPHELTRAILVDRAQFTKEGLDRRFDAFVTETAGRFQIARLEIYTGSGDPRGDNCKCIFDVTYDYWTVLYNEIGGQPPPSAELLNLNGDIAVRIRDASGEVTSRTLKGRSPYSLALNGTTLDLLHVAITDGPRLPGVDSSVMLHFYLVAHSEPTEALARKALAELRARTPSRNIEVVVRRDPWFITDMDFPVVTPYRSGLGPPSRAQYEAAPQVRCTESVAVSYCKSTGDVAVSPKPAIDRRSQGKGGSLNFAIYFWKRGLEKGAAVRRDKPACCRG